jgi:oxygen-independent coproporphyrinogen-3 oxidase
VNISTDTLPLGLYIHLPWCVRKCPYCDFNSHERRGEMPEADYLRALRADLDFARPAIDGRRFSTVFFGGGTPSLFAPDSIGLLLTTLDDAGLLEADAEITLEANPGAVDAARFAGYHAAGVNRLSLGVQSFDDRHLKALGRIHDGAGARAAIDATAAVFANFNLDLMYGLPGQTPDDAAADVEQAIASGAPHLSCYELTIEPNTVFYKHPPERPSEDVLADIEAAVDTRLSDGGYRHYEISAHAREGQACRHNLNYWTFGDYLGLGAGAHSKLTETRKVEPGMISSEQAAPATVRREARVRIPASYMSKAGTTLAVTGQRVPESADLLFEFMLNVLRLRDGFALDLLTARTGLDRSVAASGLNAARERGLLEPAEDQVRPTARGRRFLNEIIRLFLPPA